MEPNRPTQVINKSKSSNVWTIMSIVVVIAIIVGIYFATRTAKNTDVVNDTSSVGLNSSDSSVLGADRVSVTATPKSLEVMNLQTFPYKVQAKVSLDLPNSCSSATGSVTQSGKIFTITVASSEPKDAVCAQVITPTTVTVDIPVAGLPAGTYTVNYGTFTKTFTLAEKNEVDYMTSDK